MMVKGSEVLIPFLIVGNSCLFWQSKLKWNQVLLNKDGLNEHIYAIL